MQREWDETFSVFIFRLIRFGNELLILKVNGGLLWRKNSAT